MANIDFRFDINDFTLEETISNNNVLNQGQTNSIEFRFYFGDYTSGSFVDALTNTSIVDFSCLLNIERPDGSSSNNIATTPISDASPKYYKFVISDWVTEHDGQITITPKRVNNGTNVTQTFGAINLSVLASASQSSDTIEDTQYQALVTYLQAASGSAKQEVRASGAISALDLVMFVGTVGASGKLLVSKATQAVIKNNPEYKLGIALTDATNNQDFSIQISGIIENVDTSAFTEGKILVPSATIAGGLIESDNASAPEAPLNRTPIAAVIYSHQNQGILYVRPTIFPKMNQVKDVYLDYSQMTQGQGLVWNTTNNRFEAGFSGGVFYDDNLPAEADRFPNLTYFDED